MELWPHTDSDYLGIACTVREEARSCVPSILTISEFIGLNLDPAVSGLGASQADAQEQVLVGMGLVAGSSVMVLTALWGSCLIVGRCDLVTVRGNLVAKDKSLENGFSLTGMTNSPSPGYLLPFFLELQNTAASSLYRRQLWDRLAVWLPQTF